MAEPSERKLPYITAAFFYYTTAHSLNDYPLPQAVRGYLFAGVVILVIALVLLSFIKISIHTAGMGAFMMLTLFISNFYGVELLPVLIIAVLLSGFLASARLYLNAHTPAEVYTGFVVGMLSVTGVFWVTY